MNKSELVKEVAGSVDVPKATVKKVLDGLIGSIEKALIDGDTVTLIGFGTFSLRSRAARVGRNPQTGEKLNIPASKAPAFKPGKAFKDAVN